MMSISFFNRSAKMHRISLLSSTSIYEKETQVRANLKTKLFLKKRMLFCVCVQSKLAPVFLNYRFGTVCLAHHSAAAGEYDPSLRRHG